jgi:hypothetical protein
LMPHNIGGQVSGDGDRLSGGDGQRRHGSSL